MLCNWSVIILCESGYYRTVTSRTSPNDMIGINAVSIWYTHDTPSKVVSILGDGCANVCVLHPENKHSAIFKDTKYKGELFA